MSRTLRPWLKVSILVLLAVGIQFMIPRCKSLWLEFKMGTATNHEEHVRAAKAWLDNQSPSMRAHAPDGSLTAADRIAQESPYLAGPFPKSPVADANPSTEPTEWDREHAHESE